MFTLQRHILAHGVRRFGVFIFFSLNTSYVQRIVPIIIIIIQYYYDPCVYRKKNVDRLRLPSQKIIKIIVNTKRCNGRHDSRVAQRRRIVAFCLQDESRTDTFFSNRFVQRRSVSLTACALRAIIFLGRSIGPSAVGPEKTNFDTDRPLD